MTDEDAIAFLKDQQVTYEVASNGLWTCRVCGRQALFVNTIKHCKGCELQSILGGLVDE